MIGGQVIIPLRSRDGGKVVIGLSPTNIKVGTFAKIKRAIEMQKELVFKDVIIGSAPGTHLCSFSTPGYSIDVSGVEYFTIFLAGTFTSTTAYEYVVRITSSDTAYFTDVTPS